MGRLEARTTALQPSLRFRPVIPAKLVPGNDPRAGIHLPQRPLARASRGACPRAGQKPDPRLRPE